MAKERRKGRRGGPKKTRRWPKGNGSIVRGIDSDCVGPAGMHILGLVMKLNAAGKGAGVNRLCLETGFAPRAVMVHLHRLKAKGLISAEMINTRGKESFGPNSVTSSVKFILPDDL